MVVDTSALVALMRNESNFQAISKCIVEAPRLLISAVSVLETRMVLTRWPSIAEKFDRFLQLAGARTVPADEAICVGAFEVFAKFRKGRHRAALTICDCISFATAVAYGELFLEHEAEDLASFLQLAMLNGWDGYVLTQADYVRMAIW